MSTLEKVKIKPTRGMRRSQKRKEGPSSAETMQAKAVMETTADGHKKIIWYEIATNFSKYTDEILVNYENVGNYVSFTILSIGNKYFDIESDFIERFAKTTEDENKIFSNIGKSINDGSFYGTGTGAIADLTDDYQIHVLDKKTKKFETIDRKKGGLPINTTDLFDENTLDTWKSLNVKVAQTFKTKTNRRYTHEEIIDEFKKVISVTEGYRIHKEELSVKFNGTPISPILTVWDMVDINGFPIPEFNYIKDSKGKDVKVVSITHKDFYGKIKQIDFEISAVGKRKVGEKGVLSLLDITNDESGDRPYLILRLKDTKKVIGIIFLRNRGGDINLNRVVVEAFVERDDIIGFFARMAKGEKYVQGFEAEVGKEFRKQLEKFCYTAEETKEECKQRHLYNILVNDSYGPDVDKDGANKHRIEYGIDFLNKLTPKQRGTYVTMETKDGPNRYDITVRVPKKTNIKISGFHRNFDEEVIVLFENKKGNFKEPHIDQSACYAASCTNCVAVYGVGIGISDDMVKEYDIRFAKMQSSNQFRLGVIGGGLFDIDKNFFQYRKYENYWREYVNNKLELDNQSAP